MSAHRPESLIKKISTILQKNNLQLINVTLTKITGELFSTVLRHISNVLGPPPLS